MKDKNFIFDILKNADDNITDRISQDFTVLDSKERKRIFKESERKYKNKAFKIDEPVVWGVERKERKYSLIRKFSVFASAVILVSGIGGSMYFISRMSHAPLDNVQTETATETATESATDENGYHINSKGETYGMNNKDSAVMPVLMGVIGDNGIEGYVYYKDLIGDSPNSPQEAVRLTLLAQPRVLNVYDCEGEKILDTLTEQIPEHAFSVFEVPQIPDNLKDKEIIEYQPLYDFADDFSKITNTVKYADNVLIGDVKDISYIWKNNGNAGCIALTELKIEVNSDFKKSIKQGTEIKLYLSGGFCPVTDSNGVEDENKYYHEIVNCGVVPKKNLTYAFFVHENNDNYSLVGEEYGILYKSDDYYYQHVDDDYLYFSENELKELMGIEVISADTLPYYDKKSDGETVYEHIIDSDNSLIKPLVTEPQKYSDIQTSTSVYP